MGGVAFGTARRGLMSGAAARPVPSWLYQMRLHPSTASHEIMGRDKRNREKK